MFSAHLSMFGSLAMGDNSHHIGTRFFFINFNLLVLGFFFGFTVRKDLVLSLMGEEE